MVAFPDEHSRDIAHREIPLPMHGLSVSTAAPKAVEAPPEIRSNNGSSSHSKEFRVVLTEHGLGHHRIHPYRPEENGLMERANRTLREGLEGEEEPPGGRVGRTPRGRNQT